LAVIDVSQAQAGMTLAADVLDKRGRILIPSGAELKEKHLSALPAWGVTRVEIEGDEVTAEADLEPELLEAAADELVPLFSLTNRTHPAMEALWTVCVRRTATAMQSCHEVPAS
jgi:hypothetical protein